MFFWDYIAELPELRRTHKTQRTEEVGMYLWRKRWGEKCVWPNISSKMAASWTKLAINLIED